MGIQSTFNQVAGSVIHAGIAKDVKKSTAVSEEIQTTEQKKVEALARAEEIRKQTEISRKQLLDKIQASVNAKAMKTMKKIHRSPVAADKSISFLEDFVKELDDRENRTSTKNSKTNGGKL